MRAVVIREHGAPDVLQVEDVVAPAPGPHQVLVRNALIGVNFVDLQHRQGGPYPVSLPLVPGTEAAGHVVAVGDGAPTTLLGRPVVHFGHLSGVYAEVTAVDARYVVPLPDGFRVDDAAALTMAGTTAGVLVDEVGRVRAGDRVAVHAASGSTGRALVRILTDLGADVIALASSPERAHAAVALGARDGVVYDASATSVENVLEISGGGVDVVFDGGGGPVADSIAMLRRRGTVVLYGTTNGSSQSIGTGALSGLTSARGAGSLGIRWAAASHYLEGPGDRARAVSTLARRVARGVLAADVAATLPLEQASEAHRLLEHRQVMGKIVLRPDSTPN